MGFSDIWDNLLRAGGADCAQRLPCRNLSDIHILLDDSTKFDLDKIIASLWASTPRRLSRSEVVREILRLSVGEIARRAESWQQLPAYAQLHHLQELAARPAPRPLVPAFLRAPARSPDAGGGQSRPAERGEAAREPPAGGAAPRTPDRHAPGRQGEPPDRAAPRQAGGRADKGREQRHAGRD